MIIMLLVYTQFVDSEWRLGRGGSCHMGSADRHQTFSPTFRRAKMSNRQNRALPYLKAQDGTTLNVVFEPQPSPRRSNQAPPVQQSPSSCSLSERKKKGEKIKD